MVLYTAPPTPAQRVTRATSSLAQKRKNGKQAAVVKPRAGQQKKKRGVVRKEVTDYGNGSYIGIEEYDLDRGEGTSAAGYRSLLTTPSREQAAQMSAAERYLRREVAKEKRNLAATVRADAAEGRPAKVTVFRSQEVIYEE